MPDMDVGHRPTTASMRTEHPNICWEVDPTDSRMCFLDIAHEGPHGWAGMRWVLEIEARGRQDEIEPMFDAVADLVHGQFGHIDASVAAQRRDVDGV